MATNSVKVNIVLRHDTEQNWKTKNPVLLEGEAAVNTDNNLIKIGDGRSTWDALSYVNDAKTASHYEGDANGNETDTEVIARVLADITPNTDDIFIVKRVISGTKISRTIYVYDGEKWIACVGNYDAENVYFDSDLIATAPIGTVTIPASGSTTIAAEGKSVKQVLSAILAQEKNPTATAPSATITLAQAGAKEVGTSVTPSYTTKFNAGSYTYGPETGITVSSYSVSDGAATKETATGAFDPITVGDSTNYKLSLTANYTDGAVPKTNLGNNCPEKQIKAGKATANSGAITGYRSFFYGVVKTDALDSSVIRALTNGGAYNSAKTLTVSVTGNDNVGIVVAYPADSTRGGIDKVLLTTSMNADITADYVVQANVNVEGLNGYTAKAYKVYMYKPASLTAGQTHKITLK